MERVGETLEVVLAEGEWKQWVCPTCNESTQVRKSFDYVGECSACSEKSEAKRVAEAKAENRRRLIERWPDTLQAWGVPPRYASVPRELSLPGKAARWRGEPWCLAFIGANGRGKTWAATAVYGRALLDSGAIGEWWNVASLVEQMRRDIDRDDRRSPAFDRAWGAALLLLDDYAAMRETDYGLERIRLILSHRYDYLLPTIITSDQPLSEVEPRLASRIGRRHNGESYVIELRGEDRRRSV